MWLYSTRMGHFYQHIGTYTVRCEYVWNWVWVGVLKSMLNSRHFEGYGVGVMWLYSTRMGHFYQHTGTYAVSCEYVWNCVWVGVLKSVLNSHHCKWHGVGWGDCTVRLWDILTYCELPSICLYIYAGHKQWVLTVAWSPNGRSLASGMVIFNLFSISRIINCFKILVILYIFTYLYYFSWYG